MVIERVRYREERFQVADDTAAVTGQLIKLLAEFTFGGKQVHDANIVATMLAYDVPCLLTHNVEVFLSGSRNLFQSKLFKLLPHKGFSETH